MKYQLMLFCHFFVIILSQIPLISAKQQGGGISQNILKEKEKDTMFGRNSKILQKSYGKPVSGIYFVWIVSDVIEIH